MSPLINVSPRTQKIKTNTIYRPLFMKFLKDMRRGDLTISEPDGSETLLGGDEEGVSAVIRVRRPAFFKKCVLFGDIGFGESYVDGDWETDSLTDVVRWFIENSEDCPAVSGSKNKNPLLNLLSFTNRLRHLLSPNNLSGSQKNIAAHYDLSNDFFKTFLDPSMTYSCAYFKDKEQSLEDAQTEKYDRLCRKLRLKPGDRVLEIGSGWGGFALHAAKKFGSQITTITVSREQQSYALEKIQKEGLTDKVRLLFADYRSVKGYFDKIASIEMIEAVGDRYFEAYFAQCHKLLKPEGLLGMQIISCADSRYEKIKGSVDWIQKHVFPGSILPSMARLNDAVRRTGNLQLFDLEDMGRFYGETLSRWSANFERNLEEVKSLGFDESFIRKWRYYFSYCEAAFRTRHISVLQAVYSRPNNSLLTD